MPGRGSARVGLRQYGHPVDRQAHQLDPVIGDLERRTAGESHHHRRTWDDLDGLEHCAGRRLPRLSGGHPLDLSLPLLPSPGVNPFPSAELGCSDTTRAVPRESPRPLPKPLPIHRAGHALSPSPLEKPYRPRLATHARLVVVCIH